MIVSPVMNREALTGRAYGHAMAVAHVLKQVGACGIGRAERQAEEAARVLLFARIAPSCLTIDVETALADYIAGSYASVAGA